MKFNLKKAMLILLLFASVTIIGVSGYTYYQQTNNKRCEACGMLVTPEIETHIKITDGNGLTHYACCQGCMLRLLDPKKGSNELHIVTYCDYYGPNYKIIIDASENGNKTVTMPNTAMILLGTKIVASCANNRIVYNQTAADQLLATGFSDYTMSWQQNPLPAGTPKIPVQMATVSMAQKGIGYTPPSSTVPLALSAGGIVLLCVSIYLMRKNW